jgi:glutathione peroxidase
MVTGLCIIAFAGYVEIINLNSKGMTYRQKILKAVYPAFMWVNKLTGKRSRAIDNSQRVKPPESIYRYEVRLNNGAMLSLESLRGKKILLVNTASDCGYTDQYDDLQQLFEQHGQELVVIGFPANDFKEQEKGSDEEIAEFCRKNYGVGFPLAAKSRVIKGEGQNDIFRWLTHKSQNGWNDRQPAWNFSKYLVNEQGVLTHYFDPGVSPMSKEIIKAVSQ